MDGRQPVPEEENHASTEVLATDRGAGRGHRSRGRRLHRLHHGGGGPAGAGQRLRRRHQRAEGGLPGHRRLPDQLVAAGRVRRALPGGRRQADDRQRQEQGDRRAGRQRRGHRRQDRDPGGRPGEQLHPVHLAALHGQVDHLRRRRPRPDRADQRHRQAGAVGLRAAGPQPGGAAVGPGPAPGLQHHRGHRPDQHQGHLLPGRDLHGVPAGRRAAAAEPGGGHLRRHPGPVEGQQGLRSSSRAT